MTELKISKYSQPLAVLYAMLKDKYSVETKDGYSQATQSGCKTWKVILLAYLLVVILLTLLTLLIYSLWC